MIQLTPTQVKIWFQVCFRMKIGNFRLSFASILFFSATESPLQMQASSEREGNERKFTQLSQRLNLADLRVNHCEQLFCQHGGFLLWRFST